MPLERNTIIIIGVIITILVVTGAIVAIVLLLPKKVDAPSDSEETTPPPTPSADEGGTGGSPGGSSGGDTSTERWNTIKTRKQPVTSKDEELKSMSGYIITAISKDELGDTADEARDMCVQKAEEINQDTPNLVNKVCAVGFYPGAFGSSRDQSLLSEAHNNNPCLIFSDCTTTHPAIVDATSTGQEGVETLFTDSSLFCERSNWKSDLGFDKSTSTFPSIPADQMNQAVRNIPIGGASIVTKKTESPRTEGLNDDDTVYMIPIENLEDEDEGVVDENMIAKIRGKCLERAAAREESGADVCGINFYPDAFNENRREQLNEVNRLWPCQVFVQCDSNPGYDDKTEEQGVESLFTRSELLCSNSIVFPS